MYIFYHTSTVGKFRNILNATAKMTVRNKLIINLVKRSIPKNRKDPIKRVTKLVPDFMNPATSDHEIPPIILAVNIRLVRDEDTAIMNTNKGLEKDIGATKADNKTIILMKVPKAKPYAYAFVIPLVLSRNDIAASIKEIHVTIDRAYCRGGGIEPFPNPNT